MYSIVNGKSGKIVRNLLYGGPSLPGHSTEVRPFIFNAYSLLTLCSLVVFGVQHILPDGRNSLLGYLEVAAGIVVAINMLVFRLRRNVALARAGLLILALGVLALMLLTGGLGETGIFWFFVFPVGAFFLAGKRGGVWWMAGLFGVILVILLLSQADLIYTPYSLLTMRQLMVSLLVVTVGIYAYQHSREVLADKTKQSEEASKEEKIKSETLIENIDEGVIAIDRTGQAVSMNAAAEEMLGWERGELIGRKFAKAIPMLDKKGVRIAEKDHPLSRTLKRPEIIQQNATYIRKDGKPLPVATMYRSIVMQGRVRGAINTFRDIAEEQRIDQSKSEFMTLASHQLRTPISAIKWYTEMLLSGDVGSLSKEQVEHVREIYSSNVRLGDIVDAMLTLSALELGKLSMRPEPLQLPELCHRLLVDLQHAQPTHKKLHITEFYDPDLPALFLDPAIIKTILHNVLSNAIKYTPADGGVSVTIVRNLAQHREGQATIDVTVTDTGYGIPVRQQKNVFVKLFRAANIKKKDTDGSGLGLYITKGLLEQVGGQISFSSTEDQGSTFVVRLPLKDVQPRGNGKPTTAVNGKEIRNG